MGYSRIKEFKNINFASIVDERGVLNKYSEVHMPTQRMFASIPNDLIRGRRNLELVGMYVFLAMHAGTSPVHGSRRVELSMVSYSAVAKCLKSSDKHPITSRITGLIEELAELGFITIEPIQGSLMNIVIKQKQENAVGGFAKIYPVSFQKIVEQSAGVQMLKILGVYATLRSTIYESLHGNVVVSHNPSYLANRVGITIAPVERYLTWLRDHGVLAYYKCMMNNNIHSKKYYYADFHDCHNLTQTVIGYIYQGVVKSAVA